MDARNNGWIHRDVRLPGEKDAGADGMIMAWHAYQEAMLTRPNAFLKNKYYVYWRTTESITTPWINTAEKEPTKEDGDTFHCVLAKSERGETRIAHYHQFANASDLICWTHLPPPPSDYRELRRME